MLCAYLLGRRKVSPIFIDGNMHIINVHVARETQNLASLQAHAIVMAGWNIYRGADSFHIHIINTASPATRVHACIITHTCRGLNKNTFPAVKYFDKNNFRNRIRHTGKMSFMMRKKWNGDAACSVSPRRKACSAVP